ncbi:D-inositol 3-phosphate glycosyltransferase [Flavimobilis marinus]|uniref:D-inositol-3-phosphate glycosyltransferase n=1 Tax=Flavimobilis marinus TaxID=285351 RepID=A0A1I2GVF7_9MICO|nr:D-inositol-3-phosphate glycosyltransferase [Flavimobilis marinus]GHG55316.1 D-inositol 3-phosphate glycosyltransferase [Flavimobilis marinus]SFF20807.1 D-inositol-3-phosphate glycosyltransferase [Flavimobilis marinus]
MPSVPPDDRLRVAMICVHTSPLDQPGTGDAGGMNVYVVELAQALARQGSEVEIFTRATSSATPEVVEVSPGVSVRHITAGPFEGLDKNDLPGQLCAFTAGVLRTEASRTAGWYDVVHAHYWLSGQAGFLAADRWDVPLVHTMHTMAKVKNAYLAPGDHPEPRGRVIGEEQVVEAADALVASTPAEADELVDMYGADRRRVHVVPPGVDLRLFRPGDGDPDEVMAAERVRLGLPDGPLVLFAGRVQPLKGPDVVVEALAAMRDAGRTVPTLVVLGGPSGRPTALRELQALAAQVGVADHLVLHPPVPRTELAGWFRAADLVVVPSHSESFGLVAVEAQACGTPVVAAAVGGLRTVVRDGESGVLVRGHEPARWGQVLADLLDAPEERARLREGAARAGASFGWDEAASAMLEVYREARDVRRASLAAAHRPTA